MMKINKQIPYLLEEGIRNIAYCGYEHVYEEIIEEYAEKLKQDFLSQMKEKIRAHTTIMIENSLDSVCQELRVKVEVDVKGVEWK